MGSFDMCTGPAGTGNYPAGSRRKCAPEDTRLASARNAFKTVLDWQVRESVIQSYLSGKYRKYPNEHTNAVSAESITKEYPCGKGRTCTKEYPAGKCGKCPQRDTGPVNAGNASESALSR